MSEMMNTALFRRPRTGWVAAVEIKDLLTGDDSDENAARVSMILAQRLRDSGLFTGTNFVSRFSRTKTLKGFNRNLEYLYNFCDDERIWFGL